MEGHWKFLGGGGSLKPTFLKQSMKLNWNFLGGGVCGGVWIFSGTAHCLDCEQSLFCSKIRGEKDAEHESRVSSEAASSARRETSEKRDCNDFIQRL